MKSQDGYLTQQSGKWLGHFSRWVTDYKTGEKKRQQRAFVIGPVKQFSKIKARDALRERMVSELGLTADRRVTLEWFIKQRWQPMREGNWRASTRQTNLELLKVINARFGSLADLVNAHAFAPGEQLNIIGHSRGGDVALEATQYLSHNIDNLITLATPVYQTNDDGSGGVFNINMNLIGTWINVTTAQDWVAPFDSTMSGHYPGAYNLQLNAKGYGHYAAHSAIYQNKSLRQQWWQFWMSHSCTSWVTTSAPGAGTETTCAD
ncbi:MAG: hypothetical protein WA899_20780 [Candidatus Sulfotelmatobacter sp.]